MDVLRAAKVLRIPRLRPPPTSVINLNSRITLGIGTGASNAAIASTPARPRGALIVFEGIDRCGKSTQAKLLVEALRRGGTTVEQRSFPDRSTAIGQSINEYLQDSDSRRDDAVVHLLFTANRFEKRADLLRLLAGGITLVLDRYSYSGVAYSVAKGLPDLDMSYCRAVEVGLPAADLVVYMALDAEKSAARAGYGSERYEKLEFQRKVAQEYEALRDERWLTVDAQAPADYIHSQVLAAVGPVVAAAAGGAPLGRLWDYQPLPLPPQKEGTTAAA